MQLNVSVTQNNIMKGVRRSPTECAVALGIKRALPEGASVSVTADLIRVTLDGQTTTKVIATPEQVSGIVHAIDSGWVKYVRPFNFTLNLPG